MKTQQIIDSTDLDMTEDQVKAFFLGILCAEKPLPFPKAFIELTSEVPESQKTLEAPFKEIWDQLTKNLKTALAKMLPLDEDVLKFISLSKDQLDYFLTGLSLSGTNIDNCKDPQLSDLINELEEMVEDMDDFLSDTEATEDDGVDFKEYLLETWKDFIQSKP